MIGSADDARLRIEKAVRDAERNVERSRDLNRDMESMRVRGRSRDGNAEVVLSSTGALVDLVLGGGLEQAPLREIRAAILQANTEARTRAAEEINAVAARHFGAESRTVEQFEDHYARVLRLPDAATGEDDAEGGGPR